jgi:hypothetical protein
MAQCAECGKKIPYHVIASRPMRRRYLCKNCGAKLEVDHWSYFFRILEVVTLTALSIYFSYVYSVVRKISSGGPVYLKSSILFLLFLLFVLFPVDYWVWRRVVRLKKI